jgi:hypothetical protein
MIDTIEASQESFERPQNHDFAGLTDNSASNSRTKKRGCPPAGTPDWAPRFIGALMEGMSVFNAAHAAGVDPGLPYKRRAKDDLFRREWNAASDIGTRILEQEAVRRAFHGTIEPVFYKGQQCGGIRKYSDTLMIFLLKSRKPHVYRDGDGLDGARSPITININIVEENSPSLTLNVGLTDETQGNQQNHRSLPEATPIP